MDMCLSSKGLTFFGMKKRERKLPLGGGPGRAPVYGKQHPSRALKEGGGEESVPNLGGRARSGMGLEVGNVVAGGHFAPLERTVRQGAIPEVRLER